MTQEQIEQGSIEKLGRLSPAFCVGAEWAAEEQRSIDIENCVKWCENFNKNAEETGCEQRIDVVSFREWITNMIMSDE